MLRLRVWTWYLQVLYDLDLTDWSMMKSRSEVAHDKTAIIVSYTGKCKTCSAHLPTTTSTTTTTTTIATTTTTTTIATTTTSTTTIATTTTYSMRLLNLKA